MATLSENCTLCHLLTTLSVYGVLVIKKSQRQYCTVSICTHDVFVPLYVNYHVVCYYIQVLANNANDDNRHVIHWCQTSCCVWLNYYVLIFMSAFIKDCWTCSLMKWVQTGRIARWPLIQPCFQNVSPCWTKSVPQLRAAAGWRLPGVVCRAGITQWVVCLNIT